jgi:hypothetical protein
VSGTKEIRRIRRSEADDFVARYFDWQIPAIITDLYAGEPISELRTAEDARSAFGRVPVTVKDQYTTAHPLRSGQQEHDPTFGGTLMPLGAYLEQASAGTIPDRFVADEPTPIAVLSRFRTPEFALAADPLGDMVSHTFVAQKGNYAHLHFDLDQRSVLLTQVFGRKRIVLFRPAAARRLLPLYSFSGISIEHMSPAERACFFEHTGAMEMMLQPGETAFIPALYWHYVDYVDTGMSFSVRFGRNRYTRFFATNLTNDYRVQALGALLSGRSRPELGDEIVREILETLAAPAATPLARHRALRSTLERLWRRHASDGLEHLPYLFDLTPHEDVLFERFLSMHYDSITHVPASMEKPAAQATIEAIRRQARKVALSPELLARAVEAHCGRTPLDELAETQAECVLSYLRTPAAER